jgi:hypothetical protein
MSIHIEGKRNAPIWARVLVLNDPAERALGIEAHLRLHARDAWDGPPAECGGPGGVDLLWVDFGVGQRLREFLDMYWPCVAGADGNMLTASSLLISVLGRRVAFISEFQNMLSLLC